ncbi:MAG: hypothetical protein ACI4Q3_10460 [Kiritimatiellia bacterium]
MKRLWALAVLAGFAWRVCAYLPPVEERAGLKVSIESFPQKTERTGRDPFGWPLGVTTVDAGAPRPFPVVVENVSGRPVAGRLEVWMNDDWEVAGPQGEMTLAPGEKKTLSYVGTAKPSALDALYPVHARFTPQGVDAAEAPHPIAVFMFRNPRAPRPVQPTRPPRLGKGVFRLEAGFARASFVEVNGRVVPLPASGDAAEWGGGMFARTLDAGGVQKKGYGSHPPYRKGAGFLWSDFPLELPAVAPIRFSCANFLVSPGSERPSDGVEYKVFVLEEGQKPREICAQTVSEILTWKGMAGDLSAYAGRKITLRLWTGPGPKMDTCCDGGGWGDVRLAIGPQPEPPTGAEWAARERQALAAARDALAAGTDAAANRYRLEAAGRRYGAGVAMGRRGLIDGVLAFTDGERSIAYRGFTTRIETDGAELLDPVAEIREEKGTLRVKWSLPGVTPGANGFPRIGDLAIGPSSERPVRVYAGFGNVIEGPKAFTMHANGFALSTRHVGADYANGLSVVQAVDVPQDSLVCDGEKNLFALHAHHAAQFTFVPSADGVFEAARRFRGVSGYRKSPGRDRLGGRMCLDQWGGDYAAAAAGLRLAGKYGLNDSIFVKHDWQAWGYDYRLPEIYPPRGDAAAFGDMRRACRESGILFLPHDNYTDIYPDAENYSYDLVVFNLDGTPQKAWFNPGRFAQSYRWAPHAFRPWCLRNARLLKAGYDPDGVFIDVLTAHGPFDYLDRAGVFHSKMETSRCWGDAYTAYREGYGQMDAVCVSEAGQDHLVGTLDAGQSDHFGAAKILGRGKFADAERTPWHDIVTHNHFVLFAGGLGGRYQEENWHKGGDSALHGYGSDDYLCNTVIGGRNPMSDGPFSRTAVKTYWMQHDVCAALGEAEFLDLRYEGNIHRQHAFFSRGGEVWINRATNETWTLPNGIVLPSYGHYARTPGAESGVVLRNGIRCGYAICGETAFYDARKSARNDVPAAETSAARAEVLARNRVRVATSWKTCRPSPAFRPFVHVCDPTRECEGIVFQAPLALTPAMAAEVGDYSIPMDIAVPDATASGTYEVRYGAWNPKTGDRLRIAGPFVDGGSRVLAGRLVVTAVAGRVESVAWKPAGADDSRAARDRLLGVNRAGAKVDFGGVKTDGSFRLRRAPDAITVTPLPGSDAFTADIRLPAGTAVASVEAVEPAAAAAAPEWAVADGWIRLSADARAFAYRIRLTGGK